MKSNYDIAFDLLKIQNYEEAQKICDEFLNKDPNDYVANYIKGHIELEKEDYQSALTLFLNAENNCTNNNLLGFIKYWIGSIYNTSKYVSKIDLYDKDKALTYFKETIKFPKYPYGVLNQLADNEEDVNHKLKLYDMGISQFSDNPEFYLNKSYLLKNRIKDKPEYLKILKTGLEKTNSNSIRYLMGALFYEQKNYQQTLILFNEILESESKNNIKFALNIGIANCHYFLCDIPEALRYYKIAKDYTYDLDYLYPIIAELVITCENDKDYDLSYLFEQIKFLENTYDFYYEYITFWIDHSHDIQVAFTVKEVLKLLDSIKMEKYNNEIRNKYFLLKSLFLIKNENYQEAVKIIRKLIEDNDYEWIDKQLALEYDNYLNNIIEKKGSLKQYLNYLKNDILRFPRFREYLVKYSLGSIIDNLHDYKSYSEIVELYNLFEKRELDPINKWFEFAFSLKNCKQIEKSKVAYEKAIKNNPVSSAALNNLGVIYEENGEFEQAISFYEKACGHSTNEELYKRNLERVSKKYESIQSRNDAYKVALNRLKNETDYAIEKLSNFIQSAKKDDNFNTWEISIPSWKFPQLIGCNNQTAKSLRDQWLIKEYIFDTTKRDEFNAIIYLINPLIENKLVENRSRKFEDKWIKGIAELTIDKLDELGYFDSLNKLSKIKKKYGAIITRDFKELVSNYVIDNSKSVIVLSGSIIETLLLYYLEKKSITVISIKRNPANIISKKLYECDLIDLIEFIEENKMFGKDIYHLTNLSRIYRNFIHPGRELRAKEELNSNKAKICFLSCLETIGIIL